MYTYLPVGLGLTSSNTRGPGSARGRTCAHWTREGVLLRGVIDDPIEICQHYQTFKMFFLTINISDNDIVNKNVFCM